MYKRQAHTVGEADFTDLISPAAAVNVGYKFAPAFGARLGVSGWQAKAGWVTPSQTYQYKYLQGNLDLMADLSTLFCGFNPKRVFNGYIFGGVGLNHAFDKMCIRDRSSGLQHLKLHLFPKIQYQLAVVHLLLRLRKQQTAYPLRRKLIHRLHLQRQFSACNEVLLSLIHILLRTGNETACQTSTPDRL